jgi:hypothetical protein
VTAQLNGKLVDQLGDCYCETAGLYTIPAGTWKVVVTNSQGHTVLTNQKKQSAGGDPFYVVYWLSVPPGETLSAQSTFTVTGARSSNYEITAGNFSYTSAKSAPAAAPEPHASASPSGDQLDQTVSFEQPLWRLLLALIIALILAALIAVLVVRRRAPKSSTNPEATTL